MKASSRVTLLNPILVASISKLAICSSGAMSVDGALYYQLLGTQARRVSVVSFSSCAVPAIIEVQVFRVG